MCTVFTCTCNLAGNEATGGEKETRDDEPPRKRKKTKKKGKKEADPLYTSTPRKRENLNKPVGEMKSTKLDFDLGSPAPGAVPVHVTNDGEITISSVHTCTSLSLTHTSRALDISLSTTSTSLSTTAELWESARKVSCLIIIRLPTETNLT